MRSCLFLLAAAFGTLPALAYANPTVSTGDGLSLGFDDTGRIISVSLGSADLGPRKPAAFLELRDVAANGSFFPVAAVVRSDGNGVVISGTCDALGLDVTVRIAPKPGRLEIDGYVADPTASPRAVDVRLSLPLADSGFDGDKGLSDFAPARTASRAPRPAPADEDNATSESGQDSIYPLSPASRSSDGAGICLAIPPDHPTRFVAGFSAGPYLIYRVGLSPATSPAGVTRFRALAYRHDGAWGFRSALDRYYGFYRDSFFKRRVRRFGAWTTQNVSDLRNPQLYAFHEAGFPTWRSREVDGSGFNLELTLNGSGEGPVGRTVDDYIRLCGLEDDERLGIYSLPYTIVGQRQILQLPSLPKDRNSAMRAFETWTTETPILFDGPPQAVSYRSGEELKEIIRNSTVEDVPGQLAVVPRPYRGATLTFPQNPNPRLFEHSDRETIAQYTLDYYLPMLFRSPIMDGCYVDSLGRWCGYYNFRTEHFADSSVPLTYHGSPALPCLWNLQSHAEYLWEAGRRLHAQEKIVFANGVHPNRVMLGFACDAMGSEGIRTYDKGEGFYAARVAAYDKPYCLLNARHKVSPVIWNSCLYLGLLMGCNADVGLSDEERYLPVIIKCNEAGWRPVTRARATPAAVGVERWGGDKGDHGLLFTAMNRSKSPVDASIAIDAEALGIGPDVRATALPSGRTLDADHNGNRITIRVTLAAEEATAIELRTAGGKP